MPRLTFAELEATTCLGTTRLFTFNLTGIASHEAFSAESLLVVSVNFHQSASDSQTESLRLTGETTTAKVYFDVIFFCNVEQVQGLLYNELQDGRGEIFGKIALVDSDFTSTLCYVNTCDSTLTTA